MPFCVDFQSENDTFLMVQVSEYLPLFLLNRFVTEAFLSSVVCKVFEKMIYKKLEPIIDKEMTESQAGARNGWRTTDHVMTIKTKIEYDKYFKNETYIQFYDIVKVRLHQAQLTVLTVD